MNKSKKVILRLVFALSSKIEFEILIYVLDLDLDLDFSLKNKTN